MIKKKVWGCKKLWESTKDWFLFPTSSLFLSIYLFFWQTKGEESRSVKMNEELELLGFFLQW